MSCHSKSKSVTAPGIMRRKGQDPIVCLTAYTTPIAKLLDEHCDLLLVGDSVGMVMHGLPTTVGVTMDMMIMHGAAVVRGAKRAMVVVDMPFGSYEAGPEAAFTNAVRILQETGAKAVKLEGGRSMASTIEFLSGRGIPVMAHVGLMPQQVNTNGGFAAKGRRESEWDQIIEDAKAVEAAGAFCVVLEGIAEALAQKITAELNIPTIGIGASPVCDGQILVTDDMLGINDYVPPFVNKYAHMGEMISAAVGKYADEVRNRQFPAPEHTYAMKDEPVEKLKIVKS